MSSIYYLQYFLVLIPEPQPIWYLYPCKSPAPPCFVLFMIDLVGLGHSSKKSDVDEAAGEDAVRLEVDSSSLLVKLKDTDLRCCVFW